ncbi:phytoene/squalene synthase family protein [Macrococcus hajekii]|uniref:4,4'-diapophytoene synthase n=1 Tax=Macrococcus hajekii TaxID=198482 RepID=A0A4R6BJN4_9STAP|nr:phytoene/squalene synthase family protein [Macrococcus hajekii]TDM01929.1 phytoene/squalene synthase family protein [Macrococcus hajekii]GGB08640.1 dehydrosqualene synthase [Macrococcus hajekii]
MNIEQDYEYCRNIIKKHSKSFYYGFSQLPKDEANAVYAIYTFCRMADDIVDDHQDLAVKIEKLQELKVQMKRFEESISIDHPMWRALSDVRSKFPLDLTMFDKQLEGQMMDLNFSQPRTMEDLHYYSSFVAGSVGELLYPVLADEDTIEGRQMADSLGIAMQLTNILRDIGEDYVQHQRIYLPSDVMKTYGYTEDNLAQLTINESFIEMWERLAQDAESRYNEFYPSISDYKASCRKPLLVATLVYAEVLNEVRRHHYNCLSKRNKVSLWQKNKLNQYAEQMLKGEQR